MLALRFLATVFFLVATIALVGDMTPLMDGTGSPKVTTLFGHWAAFAPDTLNAARSAVSDKTAPWVWDVVIAGGGAVPTFVMFGAFGAIAAYLGRRRRQGIQPFAN